MLPQPDPGLLRKAQRGDERAFSVILRMYETPVYNYVLRLTNGDKTLAEDLTQEVFLRVFQGNQQRLSVRDGIAKANQQIAFGGSSQAFYVEAIIGFRSFFCGFA